MTFDFSRPGILPCQSIEALIAAGAVTSATPFDADQVQPASLDLRLGARVWRVRASFLPGDRRVEERLKDVAMHAIDLEGGAVLEKGCVYIAELQERLKLPPGLLARANPKSSSGRVDVFVRLLTDRGLAFDDVAEGYAGIIDLDRENGHDPRDFWEPLEARSRNGRPGELLLDPGEFYILASMEAVEIPVDQAAEMTPIDPSVGEFRVHYAGFFDPGFGTDEAHGAGSRGVLEVRTHDTPFLLEHGQTVARLVYEPLTERPSRLYGEGGSHYQSQGLKLSKHFGVWPGA